MAPLLLAALISAGAGLAQTGINYGISNSQRNAENEYNDPQAQMQRMIAAGINPNLAAAGISGAPNLSAQSNQVQGPSSFTQGIQDVASADSIIKNAKADVDLKEKEAAYYESLTTGKNIENEFAPDRYRELINNLIADTTKKNADSSYVQERTREMIELFPDVKELQKFKVEEVKEIINELRKRQEVEDEQIELMKTEEGLNRANERKANSEASVSEFIVANGYSPDSPEGRIIMEGASSDPEKRKHADQLLDNIIEMKDAVDQEIKNNDPVYRQKVQLEKDYHRDLADVNEELNAAKNALKEMKEKHHGVYNRGWNSWKIGNQEEYIKRLEDRKQRLTNNYHENLRRIESNASTSTGILGISHSESK